MRHLRNSNLVFVYHDKIFWICLFPSVVVSPSPFSGRSKKLSVYVHWSWYFSRIQKQASPLSEFFALRLKCVGFRVSLTVFSEYLKDNNKCFLRIVQCFSTCSRKVKGNNFLYRMVQSFYTNYWFFYTFWPFVELDILEKQFMVTS